MHTLILDSVVNRIVILGEELSADTNYSVRASTDTSGENCLNLELPIGSKPREVPCEGLYTPPSKSVDFTCKGINQFSCNLEDDRRTLALGVELSKDRTISIIILGGFNKKGEPTDYIYIRERSGPSYMIEGAKVPTGIKIPPNTGSVAVS